jgi:hypothetical protein
MEDKKKGPKTPSLVPDDASVVSEKSSDKPSVHSSHSAHSAESAKSAPSPAVGNVDPGVDTSFLTLQSESVYLSLIPSEAVGFQRPAGKLPSEAQARSIPMTPRSLDVSGYDEQMGTAIDSQVEMDAPDGMKRIVGVTNGE